MYKGYCDKANYVPLRQSLDKNVFPLNRPCELFSADRVQSCLYVRDLSLFFKIYNNHFYAGQNNFKFRPSDIIYVQGKNNLEKKKDFPVFRLANF